MEMKSKINLMTAIYISLDSYSSGLWPNHSMNASHQMSQSFKKIKLHFFLCEWNEKWYILLYYAIMYVSIEINHSLDPQKKNRLKFAICERK